MAKVLIIDDDPDIRTVMSMLLKKHDFEVQTASSKSDALEKINSLHPDIILMDVLLSGADGREICRELKKDETTQEIPIIIFSGHPSAAEKIDSYGADDFISKPFSQELLLEKLGKHLK